MRAADAAKLAAAIRTAPIPNTDKRVIAYHLAAVLKIRDSDDFVRRCADNYFG